MESFVVIGEVGIVFGLRFGNCFLNLPAISLVGFNGLCIFHLNAFYGLDIHLDIHFYRIEFIVVTFDIAL